MPLHYLGEASATTNGWRTGMYKDSETGALITVARQGNFLEISTKTPYLGDQLSNDYELLRNVGRLVSAMLSELQEKNIQLIAGK